MEQIPDLDALLTPIGGGGLLSGCSVAAKQHNPDIRIVGVETMASNDWWRSFRAGQPVKIPPPDTIADGMRTQEPGKLTFPLIHSLAEDILLVGEAEVVDALKLILMRMKILAAAAWPRPQSSFSASSQCPRRSASSSRAATSTPLCSPGC